MRSESSNNAIGATVRQWIPDKVANLTARILSALVLVPLTIWVIYLGAPYTDVVLTALAAGMAWEWSRLCGDGHLDRPGYIVIVAVTAAMAAGGLREYSIAAWIVAAGAMAAAVVAARQGQERSFWYALGALYTTLSCLSIIWLREQPVEGRNIVLWLLFLVWATDTGAYVAGRAIGGPKLAPSISPNKTWAGLAGGMVSAGLVGAVAAWLHGTAGVVFLAALSAGLAVVGQAGDLLESRLKRHFGAKDSSQLIPGHGGLLDRLDGLLAVGLVVAGLVWLKGVSL